MDISGCGYFSVCGCMRVDILVWIVLGVCRCLSVGICVWIFPCGYLCIHVLGACGYVWILSCGYLCGYVWLCVDICGYLSGCRRLYMLRYATERVKSNTVDSCGYIACVGVCGYNKNVDISEWVSCRDVDMA